MPSTIVPHSNRLLLWLRILSSLTRKALEFATVNDEAMKFFVCKAAEKKSFCVKLLFFAAVVFELLSAMGINFSCRSLYRRSPWNFTFLSSAYHRQLSEKTHKSTKFLRPKRISNSRKVSFWRSRCFFSSLSFHKHSFTPLLVKNLLFPLLNGRRSFHSVANKQNVLWKKKEISWKIIRNWN